MGMSHLEHPNGRVSDAHTSQIDDHNTHQNGFTSVRNYDERILHSKGRRSEYSKVFLREDKKVMRLSHLKYPSGRVSYAQASQRDYHSTYCNGLTVWEIMTEIVSRDRVHGIQICFSEEHTGNTVQKSKVLSSFNDAIRTCYTLLCRDTHA